MSETQKGIRCSECGSRMEVANVVRPSAGRIVRYRECPKCKHRAKTIETVDKQLPKK